MDTAKQSQMLAKALELAAASSNSMTDIELTRAFDEIEREYLPKFDTSTQFQLETRRRVAQWKFRLLSERNLPLEEIARQFLEVSRLGFSGLENEVTMAIYFAQYGVRTGNRNVARKALQETHDRLMEVLAADPTSATRDLLVAVDDQLARIK